MDERQDILIYQNADGTIKLDVHLQDESVWVNRQQMSLLFNRDVKTIGKHINNVFAEGELEKNSTVANFATVQNEGAITEEDEEAGYIYVLKSKSKDERIASIQNLYKIGYSKTEVEERIKNAEKQPTYLMAPISILGVWKGYNMNPQKLEQLLHNFFGSSCLNVDVFDDKGKRYSPQEWFIAPLEIIEQAIELIINGKIVNYKFDAENMSIVGR